MGEVRTQVERKANQVWEARLDIERAKYGYIPAIFREFDVVHHSHQFSPEYIREKGLVTPALVAQERVRRARQHLPQLQQRLVRLKNHF